MANNEVQFDISDGSKSSTPTRITQNYQSQTSPQSKLVTWIISYSGGLIKNQTQANIFLLICFIILTSITFSFFAQLTNTEIDEKYYFDPNRFDPELDI